MIQDDDVPRKPDGPATTRTIAMEIVAGLLVIGLLYLMGSLLIPFVLALVLAIALSRPANWLHRKGLPATLANLLCTIAVVALLAGAVGLLVVQAGSILGRTDTYLDHFAELLDKAARWSGGDKVIESLGDSAPEDAEATTGDAPADGQEYWRNLLKQNARFLGSWLASGIGGAVGLIGGVVLFLSFLFYMLETRAEWTDRIILAAKRLGLRPGPAELEAVREQTVRFLGAMSLVALGYTVVVSLVLWLVGVPQPLLWGILTGLLEFVPYFGPVIATAMPLVVSLSLGKWWAPLVVLGQYAALHTVEQYVITPLIYGRAVKIDPVLLLVAILFFGWLWGPLGLVVAPPVTILLRGLIAITPETPALDALMEPEPPKG